MSPTPTPCASCHVNNNYTLNSADCYGCHQAAFISTTTIGGAVPNHVTAGFPTTASACATCHPITTWAAGVFDHSSTGFPLTNSHATVACNLCHINNNYALTIAPTDCGIEGANARADLLLIGDTPLGILHVESDKSATPIPFRANQYAKQRQTALDEFQISHTIGFHGLCQFSK